MQKTIFTILTDKYARTTSAVEASLDKDFSVGAPWFNKSTDELASINKKIT